jgi:hypothetical protein
VGLKVKTRAHASHFAYSLAARVFSFFEPPMYGRTIGIAHTQLIYSLTKIAEDALIISTSQIHQETNHNPLAGNKTICI